MKSNTIVWSVVVALILLGGIYWWTTKSQTEQTAVVVTPTPSTTAGINGSANQTNTGQSSVPPVVTVATDSTLGNYLVASNGMTLYMYTKDVANVSNCSGTCATAWPPYSPVSNEPLVAGDGITGQISTITRADGTSQLTYNGQPLYYFAKDTKAGDTTGQNVGKVWFVVKP